MDRAPRRRVVKRWLLTALATAGFLVAYGALVAITGGRPRGRALELLALGAVGILPPSIALALPIAGLGLALLPWKATRGSGMMLSAYAGAYLCGVIGGAGLFLALRAVGW